MACGRIDTPISERAESAKGRQHPIATKADPVAQPLPPRSSTHQTPPKNEPRFDAREELYRTCGMDLTQGPGIQSGTALVLVAELGPDFAERFPTAKHFGSWLGLCPDHRITGGKIMSSSTRDVKSRAATALRLAAQGLNKAQNYCSDLYRRWKARLGTPKAITAMAHKLARILWHLFKYRQAFDPEGFKQEEKKCNARNSPASTTPPPPSASNSSQHNDLLHQLIRRPRDG